MNLAQKGMVENLIHIGTEISLRGEYQTTTKYILVPVNQTRGRKEGYVICLEGKAAAATEWGVATSDNMYIITFIFCKFIYIYI